MSPHPCSWPQFLHRHLKTLVLLVSPQSFVHFHLLQSPPTPGQGPCPSPLRAPRAEKGGSRARHFKEQMLGGDRVGGQEIGGQPGENQKSAWDTRKEREGRRQRETGSGEAVSHRQAIGGRQGERRGERGGESGGRASQGTLTPPQRPSHSPPGRAQVSGLGAQADLVTNACATHYEESLKKPSFIAVYVT